MRGFPPSTKLPLFLYKVTGNFFSFSFFLFSFLSFFFFHYNIYLTISLSGSYEYFYAKLKPLLTYRDLKTEVFQAFREFGNTLCFVYCLDKVMVTPLFLSNLLSLSLSKSIPIFFLLRKVKKL